MASIVNEIVSVIVKLVITVAGTAFMTYGIPYLKQIGMYKIVQMAVRAAEKLGVTGAIQKADKKKYVIAALEKMNIKITPTIEMMIEAAVKEMDMKNKYFVTPVITISMGKLGVASRLCGEVFGSAMTFASAGDSSAPGQISIDVVNAVLDSITE